jgi:hypothetical protein
MCPMAETWQRNRKAKEGEKDQGVPAKYDLSAGVEFSEWLHRGEMDARR